MFLVLDGSNVSTFSPVDAGWSLEVFWLDEGDSSLASLLLRVVAIVKSSEFVSELQIIAIDGFDQFHHQQRTSN